LNIERRREPLKLHGTAREASETLEVPAGGASEITERIEEPTGGTLGWYPGTRMRAEAGKTPCQVRALARTLGESDERACVAEKSRVLQFCHNGCSTHTFDGRAWRPQTGLASPAVPAAKPSCCPRKPFIYAGFSLS